MLDFYKEVEDYKQKAQQEDPDRTFDDEDTSYQRYLASKKPPISPAEVRQLERQKVISEATTEAERRSEERMRKELEERDRRILEIEARPRVNQAAQILAETATANLAESEGLVGEVGRLIKEKGMDGAAAENPRHVRMVKEEIARGATLAAEYTALATGLSKPDSRNPDHNWMIEFIREQGTWLEKQPDDVKKRDGKIFLARGSFAKAVEKDPGAFDRYWTLSDQDVVTLLSINAQRAAAHRIQSDVKELESSGFKRQVAQPPAPPKVVPQNKPPTPEASPKVKVGVGPGGATGSASTFSAMSPHELELLGIGSFLNK